ncbi:MAG: Zn-ribbon domain-containing OB-fold protein [Chloroflexi bacterium]|nr:Zn-ribbon domain-containing OB-fold protein [Chloroflexota bacterium]
MTHHTKRSVADIPDNPITEEVVAISDFQVTVGATGSKFLFELRDNKNIMGIKCPTCKKIYVPPRTHCPTCFARMSEWVNLSGKGTLETFTVVRYQEPYMPKEAPYAYGVIKLDGADTGIVHMIGGVDLDKIKVGTKMEPVFREQREGSILDIEYFKPV